MMWRNGCAEEKDSEGTGERDTGVQDWVFNEIMDQMNTNIYVTELDTGKILFMNKTMKKAFGLEHPEGQVCWKILQSGMSGPCAFCPVTRLDPAQLAAGSRVWEEHNTKNGRIYENYDSLMRWPDGRLVHFQHSTDVTEMRRLFREAAEDELTGVLNRRAGKAALQSKLDQGRSFVLCMLDVDDLKRVNDSGGHQAGDRVLVAVADAVQAQLGPEDVVFRLSGDEFVVLLEGEDRPGAVRRMNAAQALLKEGAEPNAQFCFGLADASGGLKHTIPALINAADADLYNWKRRIHIQRAAQQLRERPRIIKDPKDFTYDEGKLYDALLQSTDDYIYVCDMKTGVFYYPQAMVDEFDLPGQMVENAAAVWGARVHEHDRAAFLEANQEIADGRADSHCVEYRALNRKGEWVWTRCRGHLERDADGTPALFAGFITNPGKRNKVDQLTGLWNRLAFEETCVRLLAAGPVALVILGIDDLKRINNLYDRAFGDEVIRIVSQRIQSLLPANAQVYRLDGDEFGVVIRDGSWEAAQVLFHALRDSFSTQQTYDGKKFFCTLSCGCVFAPGDGADYLGLLNRAHCALDFAKRRGKDRMERFTPEIMAHLKRDLELTELLRESVEDGFKGFQVFCQPVFRLDRSLLGAEALCRWSCEKYGGVSPLEFIGLLEDSGLIQRVGRWIFREAVRQCAAYLWAEPQFLLSINLSVLQMDDPELADYLLDTVNSFGVEPRHIILELTESCLAANLDRLSGQLARLREAGFQIAMDDFGTGYSSLGLLKQAPIDIVKLDSTFVKDIKRSPFDQAFIRLTAELCHIVGIGVCVEGVETETEYGIVVPLGVDFLQGFLLGRPCAPKEFIERHLPRLCER